MKVCLVQNPGFADCTPGSPASGFSGIDVDLFRQVAAYTNWTEVPDGLADSYGWGGGRYSFVCQPAGVRVAATLSVLTNTSSESLNDCAMAAGAITVTAQRVLDGVRFAWPHLHSGLGILTAAEEDSGSYNKWAFLKPFSLQMWIAVLLTVMAVPLFLFIIENLVHTGRLPVGMNLLVEWRHATYTLMLLCFNLTVLEVLSAPSQLLIVTFAFTNLIVVASYTANLAAVLTSSIGQSQPTISGVQDLKGLDVAAHGLYVNRLAESEYVYARPLDWAGQSTFLQLKELLTKTGLKAYLFDRDILEYWMRTDNQDCSLSLIENEVVEPFDYAVAFHRLMPAAAVEAFDQGVLAVQARGGLDRLRERYISSDPGLCDTSSGPEALRFGQVSGLWIVMGCAAGIGLLASIYSIYWHHCYMPRKDVDAATACALTHGEKSHNPDPLSGHDGGSGPLATNSILFGSVARSEAGWVDSSMKGYDPDYDMEERSHRLRELRDPSHRDMRDPSRKDLRDPQATMPRHPSVVALAVQDPSGRSSPVLAEPPDTPRGRGRSGATSALGTAARSPTTMEAGCSAPAGMELAAGAGSSGAQAVGSGPNSNRPNTLGMPRIGSIEGIATADPMPSGWAAHQTRTGSGKGISTDPNAVRTASGKSVLAGGDSNARTMSGKSVRNAAASVSSRARTSWRKARNLVFAARAFADKVIVWDEQLDATSTDPAHAAIRYIAGNAQLRAAAAAGAAAAGQTQIIPQLQQQAVPSASLAIQQSVLQPAVDASSGLLPAAAGPRDAGAQQGVPDPGAHQGLAGLPEEGTFPSSADPAPNPFARLTGSPGAATPGIRAGSPVHPARAGSPVHHARVGSPAHPRGHAHTASGHMPAVLTAQADHSFVPVAEGRSLHHTRTSSLPVMLPNPPSQQELRAAAAAGTSPAQASVGDQGSVGMVGAGNSLPAAAAAPDAGGPQTRDDQLQVLTQQMAELQAMLQQVLMSQGKQS